MILNNSIEFQYIFIILLLYLSFIIAMFEDIMKVLFWLFLWLVVMYTAMISSYYKVSEDYRNCQISGSQNTQFESWFAEWLFTK